MCAIVIVIAVRLHVYETAMTAQKVYDVKKYGAKGDGKTNDAAAIQKAIDACSKTGGRVLLPAPFTFLAGPFDVKSGIGYESY